MPALMVQAASLGSAVEHDKDSDGDACNYTI
jgi:hypothetical protein